MGLIDTLYTLETCGAFLNSYADLNGSERDFAETISLFELIKHI